MSTHYDKFNGTLSSTQKKYYEEFIETTLCSIQTKYSVSNDQVKLIHSWKHSLDWSAIHAIFSLRKDDQYNILILTCVEIKYSQLYKYHELTEIGDFHIDRFRYMQHMQAIAFKLSKCMCYVISFDSDICIYTVTDGVVGHTISQACQGFVNTLIAQPIDFLKRIENNLAYFWVGYDKCKADLISVKLSSDLVHNTIKSFPSIISYSVPSAKLKQIEVIHTRTPSPPHPTPSLTH